MKSLKLELLKCYHEYTLVIYNNGGQPDPAV